MNNYIPLLDEIRREVGGLAYRPLSWLGRINAVKMAIMPKILYKFQILPIPLSQVYFRALKGLISRFVCCGKKPRIASSVLSRRKEKGGLSLPDFYKYYKAVVLTRVIEWSKGGLERRWVNIEHSMSSKDLSHIIWNPPKYRALDTETPTLTHNALKVWDQVHMQNMWTYNSPLISLKENYFFAPGKRKVGGNWIKRDSL